MPANLQPEKRTGPSGHKHKEAKGRGIRATAQQQCTRKRGLRGTRCSTHRAGLMLAPHCPHGLARRCGSSDRGGVAWGVCVRISSSYVSDPSAWPRPRHSHSVDLSPRRQWTRPVLRWERSERATFWVGKGSERATKRCLGVGIVCGV